MQEGKVKIADGLPETRDRLNKFKSDYTCEHPEDRLKTLGDAVEKLLDIATKTVPELLETLSCREAKIQNLNGRIEFMEPFMEVGTERDKKIEVLETENLELKKRIHELETGKLDI